MLIDNQNCPDLNNNNNNNNNNNTIEFSLLHLNIRSISKKLDSFSNFLGSLSVKFSVIGITETWLNDSSHTSDISGYNFIHRHRVDRSGGGVGIYLLDDLDFKHRADLAFPSDCAESLFIEINRSKEKNILIGVIYRPPDKNLPQFIIELDQLVDRISKENKPVFLLGDWNVNLMSHSHHQATGEFLELFYSRMFFRPTRIKPGSH